MTEAEQKQLSLCEETIRGGWKTFVEVGEALTIIRDQKLYRDRYERFEDYYRTEWQYQKSQIYRLMEAAKLVKVLSPIGEDQIYPSNESQLRPLLGLAEHDAKAVWQRVQQEVKGESRRVTARLVHKHVRAISPAKAVEREGGKAQNRVNPQAKITDALDALMAMVREECLKEARQLQKEIVSVFKKLAQ